MRTSAVVQLRDPRPEPPPREEAKPVHPYLAELRRKPAPKQYTDYYLQNLKFIGIGYEAPADASGMRCLVGKKSKSLAWRYRRPKGTPKAGEPAKLILGTYPGEVTLAQARVKLAAAKEQHEKGIDPGAAKQVEKAEEKAQEAETVQVVGEEYVRALRRDGKVRSVDRIEYDLKTYVYPRIGSLPIALVKKSGVIKACEAIQDAVRERGAYDGKRTGDRAYVTINRLFNWHARRDDDFINPLPRGLRDTSANKRKRVLTDHEIVKVIRVARTMGRDKEGHIADVGQAMFGDLVEGLLRTGFRRSELANATWSEFDGNIHTLPPERNKVSTPKEPIAVVRDLPPRVMTIINRQPRHEGCEYVFSVEGRCALNKFARHKAALDRASGVGNWRLHDLRRTSRTLLSRTNKVTPDNAERALGHAIGGIRSTYDAWEYLSEKRDALVALNDLIEEILADPA